MEAAPTPTSDADDPHRETRFRAPGGPQREPVAGSRPTRGGEESGEQLLIALRRLGDRLEDTRGMLDLLARTASGDPPPAATPRAFSDGLRAPADAEAETPEAP